MVLLEGPRVVAEAAACGVPLRLLALQEGIPAEVPAERVVRLSERALRALSQTVTPQGVLAVGLWEEVPMDQALACARRCRWPLVVLDGVQDPGNVGAICRTAAAAGAPALAVLEGGADPFSAKAVRASAGHVFRLQVARGTWADLAGIRGYGAVASGGVPFFEADLEAVEVLALGGETRGLRNRELEGVTVPMAAGVESLNVAAAAAVLLFELRRRLVA